jgi:hypothetical protein
LLLVGSLPGLIFDPEDSDSIFLQHVSDFLPCYTVLHPKRQYSSFFHFDFALSNNILGDNMDTIKGSTQTLIDASMETGLEVDTEETKYMLLSRHQNAG